MQGFDHIAQVALHDAQEFVKREVDSVVGEAPLRKVVGTDAVRSVATADEAFALGSVFGGTFRAVFFLDTCGQHPQRLRLVAVLAAAILALSHDTGGQMGDAYR